MKIIDEKIIKKAINGDSRAFETIYTQTYSIAKSIAFSIIHNEHDAEDLVQESYIKLLVNLPKLKDCNKFYSYFNKTVANTCKDYQKKKKPNLFSEFVPDDETYDDFEATLATPNKENYIPEEIDKKAVSKRVMQAVNNLPEEQRSCIILHYYCEMTVDEIAEIYGVSRNTILSRLSYARKKLKKELQKDKDDKLFAIILFPFIQLGFEEQKKALPFDFQRRLCYKKTINEASKQGKINASKTYKVATNIYALPLTAQIGIALGLVAIVLTAIWGFGGADNRNSAPSSSLSNLIESKEIHTSIQQGDGYILDRENNLISCDENRIQFINTGKKIYDGTANNYLIFDEDLYFISNNTLVKYSLAKHRVTNKVLIAATDICYTSAITCVNSTDGTITYISDDGSLKIEKHTQISNATFDDGKLYYYDEVGNLMFYDIAKREYHEVFSGAENNGMKFAFQIKNGMCFYPEFESDKNGILHKSDGEKFKFTKPFVDFGVSDNCIYFSDCENSLWRYSRNSKKEDKIFDKALIFSGESNGYSAWYDIDEDKTYIISDNSESFECIIDGKTEKIKTTSNQIFYISSKGYFCKNKNDLQKFEN